MSSPIGSSFSDASDSGPTGSSTQLDVEGYNEARVSQGSGRSLDSVHADLVDDCLEEMQEGAPEYPYSSDESADENEVPKGLPTGAAAGEMWHAIYDNNPERLSMYHWGKRQERRKPVDKLTGEEARKAVVALMRHQTRDYQKPVPESTGNSGKDLWADLPMVDPEELAKYLSRPANDA
mmetsp:Transcript_10485/g.29145  ORF Transcript_10485/g.29145 Transcript_10485/m.29145 type:complete len:179 (-) Transcript_10485:116-652(-)